MFILITNRKVCQPTEIVGRGELVPSYIIDFKNNIKNYIENPKHSEKDINNNNSSEYKTYYKIKWESTKTTKYSDATLLENVVFDNKTRSTRSSKKSNHYPNKINEKKKSNPNNSNDETTSSKESTTITELNKNCLMKDHNLNTTNEKKNYISKKSDNKNSPTEDMNSAMLGIKCDNNYYKCEDSTNDGNCFYHSIVKSEHAKGMDHVQLRNKVYTTIHNIFENEKNTTKYNIILYLCKIEGQSTQEKDLKKFIEEHKKNGTWAKTSSILFTALVLKINIESIINIQSKFDILSSKQVFKGYDQNFDTGTETIYIYNHFYKQLYSVPTTTEDQPNHYAYLIPVLPERIFNQDKWFKRSSKMDAEKTTILEEAVDITNQDDQTTFSDESNESNDVEFIKNNNDHLETVSFMNTTNSKMNEETNNNVMEDSYNIENETTGSKIFSSKETIDEDSEYNDLLHELDLIKSELFIFLGQVRYNLVKNQKNKKKKQNSQAST